MTVYEALQHRSDWFEGVRKCSQDDSLMTVIEIIVKAEVHRLLVIDSEVRLTLFNLMPYLAVCCRDNFLIGHSPTFGA